MIMSSVVRIGTRASPLAQAQSRQMQARIAAALGAPPEDADRVAPLVLITTTGDRIQDRRLLEIGGKQLFTKEIEEALLDGRVDCAVHSMKDVPAIMPPGLVIAAVPEREDPRDAFVSPDHAVFEGLPEGAVLGTASLRRQAQCLRRRPDLTINMLRGNVGTRVAKLERGEAAATLLAMSGLNRLGMSHLAREAFDPVVAPPAPGQGALAIQTREADGDASWTRALHDRMSELSVAAERGTLEALEGSCRTAMGAHARLDGTVLSLVVEALTADGRTRWRREGVIDDANLAGAIALGRELGGQVREEAGDLLELG
jgi:hydroxymethylbilane synthase